MRCAQQKLVHNDGFERFPNKVVIKNDLFTQDIHIAIISVTTDRLDIR